MEGVAHGGNYAAGARDPERQLAERVEQLVARETAGAERSRRTADRLRRAKAELEAAPDLAAVRRLAGEAQTIMVEENRDWFGVAELQELEVSL
jgi:hypothetical protein